MNVIITGASSGIGRGFARTFAQKGHVVLAVARREERLLQLRDELAEKYGAVGHILPAPGYKINGGTNMPKQPVFLLCTTYNNILI